MSFFFRVLLPAILLVSLVAEIGGTQSYPGPPPPKPRGPFRDRPDMQKESEELEKSSADTQQVVNPAQRKRERYLELRKETSELVRLAAELKLQVAESNEQVLSLKLAKKADQVEKLSKRIRDRIKHGY